MIRLMAAIKCISRCSTLYRAEALEAEGLGGYQQTYLLHICEKPGHHPGGAGEENLCQ